MRIASACHARGYRIFVYCLEWQGDIPDGFEVVTVDVTGVTHHTQYQRFAEYVGQDAVWRRPAAIIGFNKMPGLDLYYAADSCYEQKAQEMRTALYRRTERYRVLSEFERAVFAQDSPTKIMLIAPDQQVQFTKYYGTPQERLRLLPPGISKDRARSDRWLLQRAAVRTEFGIAEDEYLLLLVGSGFITKGLDRLLKAVAALPAELSRRTRLLVIGQDNPSQFMRLARSLDVAERLILIKGRDDIPAILQGADLMVHPAYMESGGMVLIEAVIAGLPVIATSVCGFAHYIGDANAGVVLGEPFDQGQLNQAIVDALQDAAQRRQWSANGVAFGQTHEEMFDMPRQAVAFIEEYLHDER
jgi:UDP-glucose:(heptosyl)LPS alpha-1,3-glucosyltransferase